MIRVPVPVTVSNFGIISRNYTDFRYIPVPVHSGTFSCQPFLSTGVPFRKHENVPKIFAKQGNENVRNHCLSVSENFENLEKVQKYRSKTSHLACICRVYD